MSRTGLAGWAVALVLALVIVAGRGGDANAEREARLTREAYAQGFEAGKDSARDVLTDSLDTWRSKAREDSLAAAEASQEADRARSRGRAEAERLRATLTAEQREQLDATVSFYEVSLAEKDTVIARTESRLALARGEITALESFAARETQRADAWKDAYDAAEAEIDALRRPSLLPDLGDIPALALTAAAVLLIAR